MPVTLACEVTVSAIANIPVSVATLLGLTAVLVMKAWLMVSATRSTVDTHQQERSSRIAMHPLSGSSQVARRSCQVRLRGKVSRQGRMHLRREDRLEK